MEAELEKVKGLMSLDQARKIEEFMAERGFETAFDEFYQRKLACRLFGMNQLWWAEDILNIPGTAASNYQSSLNEKNAEKFLCQSKT